MAGPLPVLRAVEHAGGIYPAAGRRAVPQQSLQPNVRRARCRRAAEAPERGDERGGAALRDRPVRAGPGAGRRRGARVARARERRTGHRQIHAAAADLCADLPGADDPLCLRRGEREPAQAPRRAPRRAVRRAVAAVRDESGRNSGRGRTYAARPSHCGLHPDALHGGQDVLARQHRAGPRLHYAPDAVFQALRRDGVRRRPHQQGGRDRRAEGARAHGRLRPVFRRRGAHDLPPAARGKEPLRLYERDRRV